MNNTLIDTFSFQNFRGTIDEWVKLLLVWGGNNIQSAATRNTMKGLA